MINYIEAQNLSDSVKKILDTTFESLYHEIIIDKYGTIIHINNTYATYLGKSKQDIIGAKVEKIIPGTKLYETLESGMPSFDGLFEFQDGRSLVYTRLPIKNSYGELLGVVSISSINSTDTISVLYQEINRLKLSNTLFAQRLKGLNEAPNVFDEIIGVSPKIMEIKQVLSQVIDSTMPILLTGETGCGKEVFATAIHNASSRKDAPFIKVNCAAIPRELLESELFGYESGTFSGAIKGGRPGKFELANGGTILLDEIEELPLEMQSKLLRVLQEYEVERIGSVKPIPLTLQVVCCSNKDLYKMVEDKLFREDLLFRINVLEIEIPPLRERREDFGLLCDALIKKINLKYKLKISGITPSAIKYLLDYDWPGNVRELEHVIERACALVKYDLLDELDFQFLESRKRHGNRRTSVSSTQNFFHSKDIVEKDLIFNALAACNGNKSAAARQLGISRSLLYDKMKKYNLV